MALPKNGSEWPPKPFDVAFRDIAEWQMWWEGTSATLQNYYTRGQSLTRRGIVGRVQDAWESFTGNPKEPVVSSQRIHLPVAGDVFRVGAGCLFAYPPLIAVPKQSETEVNEDGIEVEVTVEDDAGIQAQDRVDLLINNPRTQSELLIAAEGACALGGAFIRVVWDKEARPDQAWLDYVDADRAIPEFLWGHLIAVTFWNEYPEEKGDVVWRHLQRYEKGAIQHALYKGSTDNIGEVQPLTDHSATAGFAEVDEEGELISGIDAYGRIPTGAPEDLAAVYVPNRRPNPAWRHSSQLKMLGHSDISRDCIPLLAAIDEVWTSLMRDVRQGKGRMVVSENLLEVMGAGKGTGFDADREFFSPVAEAIDSDGKPVIEHFQFEIREGAHLTIIEALLKEVLRRVGISPMTFGIVDSVATTATEINAQTRDTITTTMAKRRLWEPELSAICTALVRVDAFQFPATGAFLEEPLQVLWPDTVQVSDEEKARTITLLEQAGAASLETKVRMFHDEWDDKQVKQEVELIKAEKQAAMPVIADPFAEGESGGADDAADAPEPPNAGDDTSEE
jgi:hypothetical protein